MVTVQRRDPRAGYALLATLWICAGLGALTWLISVSAREATATSRNRMALTAGVWQAQGCLAYGRETLRDALSRQVLDVWQHVDRVLAEATPLAGCALSARARGARLDVNATDEATLARVLHAAGLPQPRADSAAAAITNWIATKGAFVSVAELHRVRGLESFARLDSILDVEPGAIALNVAPRELLGLLPGFTDRTIREVLDARARGAPVSTFQQLSRWLDPDASDASARLPGLILLTPDAWIVTVRAQVGTPPVTTVLEVRLVQDNQGTSVTRRRSWTE